MNKLFHFVLFVFIFFAFSENVSAQFVLKHKTKNKQFYFKKIKNRKVELKLKSEKNTFVAILDSANERSLFITNPKFSTHHLDINLSDIEMIKFKFTPSRKVLNTGLDILLGFSGILLLLDASDEFTAYLTLFSTPVILTSNFKTKKHKFYTHQYQLIYVP